MPRVPALPDTPTLLWALHKYGSVSTCTVEVTPQGLRLSTALNGREPLTQLTVQTEAEIYEWAEKFRQSALGRGWRPRPDAST